MNCLNVTKFRKNLLTPKFLFFGWNAYDWRHWRKNSKKIPVKCKRTKALHETNVMKCKGENYTYLIPVQKSKNLLISNTLHSDVPMHAQENSKKRPKTVFSIIRIK